MRLLKWWRNQQRWSSALTSPSDEVLELIAVYSALQTKPNDQRTAIANAMSLMARFEELRIVWSNYYSKEDICTTDDSVHMKVKGCVEVDLRFSPDFETYSEVIQAMGKQCPDMRKHFNTALVNDQVQFVSKQPGQVKVTMRLLKWWRNQQRWSSALTTPSDDLLELIAVYSALQTKPRDQRMAIANAMSLMARFEELRIVWSNFYGKEDIWSPLLQQRPLLMDPVNPYVNIADPQSFDASELMSLAKSTHFFW
jgi:hypothetical protein